MIRQLLARVRVLASVATIVVAATGCMEYRQTVRDVTPAASPECPDMAHGCSKTVWLLVWGAARIGQPPMAECGKFGMAEVTVRSTPLEFAVSLLTAGIAAPRQLEWKCARPDPHPGGGITSPAPGGS